MLSLSLLDAIFSIDHQGSWLKFMVTRGYLAKLCASLLWEDEGLQKMLHPQPEALKALYIHESKMVTIVTNTIIGRVTFFCYPLPLSQLFLISPYRPCSLAWPRPRLGPGNCWLPTVLDTSRSATLSTFDLITMVTTLVVFWTPVGQGSSLALVIVIGSCYHLC